MRQKLNEISMKGRVVIGEGEIDEAPMLYIGEIIGNQRGDDIDIARSSRRYKFCCKKYADQFLIAAVIKITHLMPQKHIWKKCIW